MAQKIDMEAAFPSYAEVIEQMRGQGSMFMRCPAGHGLPKREPQGRCTPLWCVDEVLEEPGARVIRGTRDAEDAANPYTAEMGLLPRGAEAEAYKRELNTLPEAVKFKAQTEEATVLMRAVGIRAAREGVHQYPELPDLTARKPGQTHEEWIKERIQELTPYALENVVFDLTLGTHERRVRATERILDMAGHTTKPEKTPSFHSPITVHIHGPTPYDAQLKGTTHDGHHDSPYLRRAGAPDPRILGDDRAERAPVPAAAGEAGGGPLGPGIAAVLHDGKPGNPFEQQQRELADGEEPGDGE